MQPLLRLTVLVDRLAARPDLETEHGLAVLVEVGDAVLLFDAGASGAAFRNAERLGLPWRRISRIVLSHGHRDHSGGLAPFLEALPRAEVYLHTGALVPRFSLHPGRPCRALGMPEEVQAGLLARRDQLRWATAPMRLGPGLGLTGPVPRRHREEAHSGPFFLDVEGRRPDPLEDDLALWIATPRGTVILMGCAHAGVRNTLEHVQALAGGGPVRAVVGGLHLAAASPARLEATLAGMRRAGVRLVAPFHCTGAPAQEAIREAWGAEGRPLLAGERLDL